MAFLDSGDSNGFSGTVGRISEWLVRSSTCEEFVAELQP